MINVVDTTDKTWYGEKVINWKRMIIALIYYLGLHIYGLPNLSLYILMQCGVERTVAVCYAQTISDGISGIILCVILLPILKEGIQQFNKCKLFTVLKALSLYIPMILVSGVVSVLITKFTGLDVSSNQEAINSVLEVNPFCLILPAVIVAPIVEELVFRGVIFRSLRKYGFIPAALVSGFCFGFLHCLSDVIDGNFLASIFTLQYMVMGIFICYSYEKSQNIIGAMLLHFLNNGIAMLLSIILLG